MMLHNGLSVSQFRKMWKARCRKDPVVTPIVIGGAAIASGVIGSNAAGKAASQQTAALREANELNRQLQEQQRTDAAPFVEAGTRATRTLTGEAFITPEQARAQGLPLDDPRVRTQGALEDPLFQFQLEQGERAINRFLGSRGQFFSGVAANALTDFTRQASGEQINRDIERNQFTASLGANVLTRNATNAVQLQGLTNQNQAAIGSAQAAGTLGQSQAITGAISGVANATGGFIQNQQTLQQNQQLLDILAGRQGPPLF